MRGQQKQSNDPHNNQHNPQYANYWAPLTRKRHIPPHPAQPQHTDRWAPRTQKRHPQEHRPQQPTESSDPTQHAKGRTGDCPGPRKGATTRRNVTRGGGWSEGGGVPVPQAPKPPHAPEASPPTTTTSARPGALWGRGKRVCEGAGPLEAPEGGRGRLGTGRTRQSPDTKTGRCLEDGVEMGWQSGPGGDFFPVNHLEFLFWTIHTSK